LLVVVVALPALLWAAPPTPAPAAASSKSRSTTAAGEPSGKESRVDDGKAGRPATKTRAGSMLKKERSEPASVDLRGEAERRRDAELIKHFTRMAELDVIEEIVTREGTTALLDRIETVRRREMRRHWDVLQQFRQLSLVKAWQGKP
jgi:hypothetical protein